MSKLKVVKPAVKEKSGKVISDSDACSHTEIEKKAGQVNMLEDCLQ